jgi:hypothetical protein
MGLKIKASTFTTQRYLEVFSDGVRYVETAALGGKRSIKFHEIDHVFLSEDGLLALQVGTEMFSIPINRSKADHLQALNALLQGVERSGHIPQAFPVAQQS